jgi:hypothetical protein
MQSSPQTVASVRLAPGSPDVPSLTTQDHRTAARIVDLIGKQNLKAARSILRQLSETTTEFPSAWLAAMAAALDDGDWSRLSQAFAEQRFIGKDGFFLFIAPFSVMRQTVRTTVLTAIFGRMIEFERPTMDAFAEACRTRVGPLREPIASVRPFYRLAACGQVGSEGAEAFVVPNNWEFADSQLGPALNDMTEQRRRFREGGRACIRRIWDADSADYLLEVLESEEEGVQNWSLEYQCHDAGHAAGIGFHRKLRQRMFETYWYGGVEEWRADGISIELAAATLSPELCSKVIRVNLAVRLALDAHRRGGIDRDADVCAALLSFDRLLESGGVDVRGGRLRLNDLSPSGALRMVAAHRYDALKLTRAELGLEYDSGVFRLYGSVRHSRTGEALFKGMVLEPCAEYYRNLR